MIRPAFVSCTFFLFIGLFISQGTVAQLQGSHEGSVPPPFLAPTHAHWADSVIRQLNLQEQIAQLLMPPVYAHADTSGWSEAEHWAEQFGIGGVICMQGHPAGQVNRLRRLQAVSKVPLLVSTDGEWGLGMRLDSTKSWPRALTFGATHNEDLTRQFGQEVGRMLRSVGVHVNFAPVVDVNSNAANPVIGSRSFGEDPEWVSKLGVAYALGMQDEGVLATAKHFPGHGDSDSDSHLTLPSILHDTTRLKEVELVPFRRLTQQGIGAMMAAHLFIPALDSTPGQPSTLSPKIIDTLLRQEIGFQGLVFTDAMTMKGFSSFAKTTRPHVDALLAGNDILLFPGNPSDVIAEIKSAIAEGAIDSVFIAKKCFRVLQAKSWCQVNDIPSGYVESDVAERNHREVIASSLTAIKNTNGELPFKADVYRIESLFVGWEKTVHELFSKEVRRIMPSSSIIQSRSLSTPHFISEGRVQFRRMLEKNPDWAILHVGGTSHRVGKKYGIGDDEIRQLEWCAAQASDASVRLCVVVYGSPYLLERMQSIAALSQAVMIAYQDDQRTINAVAQALTGVGPAGGTLPVSAGPFSAGTGHPWIGRKRLGFSPNPFAGSAALDSLAEAAIVEGATPGCRLVVAHRGQIIHDGIYGTTDGVHPVEAHTLYDLASITKIASSTLALMHLEEQGQLDRKASLATYLPELQDLELGQRAIEDILSHRAGLKAWIPFYLDALEDSTAFTARWDSDHPLKISDSCFMREAWKDSIWQSIIQSPIDPVGTHRYSDLGYYALQRVIESMLGGSLDSIVEHTFYAPFGWTSLGYLPLEHFPLETIAPTERDTVFRKVTIHGNVHDPGAAMLGGVAGHAGLFGDAYDLSRLMYMLRLGGYYGGVSLFKPETIQAWTRKVDSDPKCRKACGFDRPDNESGEGATCDQASWSSFGHSGFTGTLAWADPDHDVIFVFLSNRIFPDAENRKLIQLNVRTEMQRVVYEALNIPSRFD